MTMDCRCDNGVMSNRDGSITAVSTHSVVTVDTVVAVWVIGAFSGVHSSWVLVAANTVSVIVVISVSDWGGVVCVSVRCSIVQSVVCSDGMITD
jgi:hypothetical protein